MTQRLILLRRAITQSTGRGFVIALIASGLALAVFLILTLDPRIAWGRDNAMYLMLARNLAEGTPYNATGYIQNPHVFVAPPVYPPGFPLVLATAWVLAGLNIAVFKYYVLGVPWVAVLLFAVYARHRFRHQANAGVLAFIRSQTPHDALIMVSDPRATVLLTDRASATWYDRSSRRRLRDDASLPAYFDQADADYLLITAHDSTCAGFWRAVRHADRFERRLLRPRHARSDLIRQLNASP